MNQTDSGIGQNHGDHSGDMERRLAAAERRLAAAERRLRATWAVAGLGGLAALGLGAAPEARAQFGVTLQGLQTQVNALAARAAALESKTSDMTRLTDPATGQPTVRFSGVNVQVVSGAGTTIAPINGVGNLIVGYNETRASAGDDSGDLRTGSHNLIVGVRNNYSRYGAQVVGFRNTSSAIYASVCGGEQNTASGRWSVVSGGSGNTASAQWSSVSGGSGNIASGSASSVSGGVQNVASGSWCSVSGGSANQATGLADSVLGGSSNRAGGELSCIAGGADSVIGPGGAYAAVGGGRGRSLATTFGWAAGSESVNGDLSGNFRSP